MAIPADGSTIVFSTPPSASYAVAGEPYRVRVTKGREVWLTSVRTGAGTFDPAWAYRLATWAEAD